MSFHNLSDAEFDTFGTQVLGVLPEVEAALSIAPEEVSEINRILTDTHAAYTDFIAKRAEADASYKAYKEQREATKKELGRFFRSVKADKNYTEALGKELQIESNPRVPIDTSRVKTVLKYKLVAGVAHIVFSKNKATGIKLYARRGAETEFSLLSIVHSSPYVDSRPNLVAHQPEIREYRAMLFLKDLEIGIMSDTISITL